MEKRIFLRTYRRLPAVLTYKPEVGKFRLFQEYCPAGCIEVARDRLEDGDGADGLKTVCAEFEGDSRRD